MREPESKVCTTCKKEKSIEEFSKNQYGKDYRILRRPVCKECYAKKIKINPKQKKDFEKTYPKPHLGEEFICPICSRKFKRLHQNDVVLDHSHKDGSVRGWICSSCNTSIGKFGDDPSILKKAIEWILKKGKKIKMFLSNILS